MRLSRMVFKSPVETAVSHSPAPRASRYGIGAGVVRNQETINVERSAQHSGEATMYKYYTHDLVFSMHEN